MRKRSQQITVEVSGYEEESNVLNDEAHIYLMKKEKEKENKKKRSNLKKRSKQITVEV